LFGHGGEHSKNPGPGEPVDPVSMMAGAACAGTPDPFRADSPVLKPYLPGFPGDPIDIPK